MIAGGQCLHSRQLHTSVLRSGPLLELDSGITYNVEGCTTDYGETSGPLALIFLYSLPHRVMAKTVFLSTSTIPRKGNVAGVQR